MSVPPTLGDVRLADAAKNVTDAPDREADDQQTHDQRHDGFAEPTGGGFMNTAKHERPDFAEDQ